MRTAVRDAVTVGSDDSGGDWNGMCFVVHYFVVNEAELLNSLDFHPSLDLLGFGSCGCSLGGHSWLGNRRARNRSDDCRTTARFFRS